MRLNIENRALIRRGVNPTYVVKLLSLNLDWSVVNMSRLTGRCLTKEKIIIKCHFNTTFR